MRAMVLETDLWKVQLTVLVVGLGLCALAWWATRKARKGVRAFCIALTGAGFVGMLASEIRTIGDGAYPWAEFHITFVGEDGKPVEGVRLCVEDRDGHNSFHYPVTDYLPDQVPTSDRDGLMVFHHAGRGCEITTEKVCYLSGLVRVVTRRGPVFLCRFLHQGAEVYRVGFSELDDWPRTWETWETVPKVKRRWKWPAWPMSQLLTGAGPEESLAQWDRRAMRFFDLNGNGKLEPEEGAACRAGTSLITEAAALDELRGIAHEEDLEFPLVRRTITIPVPPRHG
jgi:hypothetical protein